MKSESKFELTEMVQKIISFGTVAECTGNAQKSQEERVCHYKVFCLKHRPGLGMTGRVVLKASTGAGPKDCQTPFVLAFETVVRKAGSKKYESLLISI